MSIQALREQRAVHANTLNTLIKATEGKAWTADNQATYDAELAAIDGIDARIKNITDFNERVAAEATHTSVIEAADKHAKDKKSPQAAVFAKWLRQGDKGMSAADIQVIQNTMSVGGAGSEGGYTVPIETVTTLIELLKQFGGMRAAAGILLTGTGHPMSFPTANATGEVGELVAENTTTTALDTAFGLASLPVFMYSSKSIAVPLQLLQDSNIDIEAYIYRLIATRIGRITNTHYTIGTGTGQPNGLVTAAATGFTAANGTTQVTSITYDSIIELQHSVDPAYRNTGKCSFMLHDTSVKVLRKIKDNNARPIFVPGFEIGNPMGAPDTLVGAPILVNQDVPVMAAGAKSLLFGDYSYYTIRDAMDSVLFRRFDDSAFGLKGQVGFCGWLRSGGNLLDNGGAVRAFVNAAS